MRAKEAKTGMEDDIERLKWESSIRKSTRAGEDDESGVRIPGIGKIEWSLSTRAGIET